MTHEHPATHGELEKKDAHATPSQTEGHGEKKDEPKKVEDVGTKIQAVLDKEIGGMRAYAQFVLTPEEVSNARREAARLVRAEEDQKELLEKAVKAATPKESEEKLEGSRHADSIARTSRRAIQSIFAQAKVRVVPPSVSEKPVWRKAIDKAIVPFAAAAGLLATAVNSVGFNAISSFPWLATGASAAGILGSVGLGGYVGGKAEQMIRKAMEFHMGRITKVARSLGITRSTLYRRLEKYNIPYDEVAD